VNDAETEAKVKTPPRNAECINHHQNVAAQRLEMSPIIYSPLFHRDCARIEIHTLACGEPRKVAGLTKTQMQKGA